MTAKRVVVTGLGTTNPLGGDVATTWEALVKGESGVRHLDDEWAQDAPVKIAGRIAVEPAEVLERVKARRLDRSSQFAMVGRWRPGPTPASTELTWTATGSAWRWPPASAG